MLNFKLHPAPHQRLISWAAAPGFAILTVRLRGGGWLYLRAFAQLFIHDETKDDRNPVPFSLLFGSISVITKHLNAVPETKRKITVYVNEF